MPGLITVGTTAVQLDAASESDYRPGTAIWITVGAADIFIGPDADVVATGNGYAQGGHRGRKCVAGSDLTLDLDNAEHVYAITASATSICEVLQSGE